MLLSFAIISKIIEIRSTVSDTELRADKASRFSQSRNVFCNMYEIFYRILSSIGFSVKQGET